MIKTLEYTLYDAALINDIVLKDAIVETKAKIFWVCPSNIQGFPARRLNLWEKRAPRICIKNISLRSKFAYDYIIIDCPPSYFTYGKCAFTAADTVFNSDTVRILRIGRLVGATKTIKTVRMGLNPSLDIEGALLTMYDSRTNLSAQVVEQVKKALPKRVFKNHNTA